MRSMPLHHSQSLPDGEGYKEESVITDRDLQELLDHFSENKILSVYLNTDPRGISAEEARLRLRSMLKEVELSTDAQIVERYFDHEFDWSGRSAVVFSCKRDNFFRAYTLAVPVRSRIRVSEQPHVKPLAEIFDSYGGYGVVLVDKQGARLFYFHLGEVLKQEGFVGESVRRMKRGGGSQSPGRRSGATGITQHIDEITERNMRSAAEIASKFFHDNNIRRIVIAGTEDNIAMFRNNLPKAWQSLIVGGFALSKTASHADILEKAVQIGQQNEERRHDRMVEAVKTAAAKGRGGVIGLDDTLQMVREGRVQTLIVQEGFRKPGYQCVDCGDIITTQVKSCSFCSGSFTEMPDAVEMAVRRVLKNGGEIEVLHDHAELNRIGKIGALLRY